MDAAEQVIDQADAQRYGSDGDGSFRIRRAGLQEGNCQSGEKEVTTSMEDCREKDFVRHIGGGSAAPGFGSAPRPSRRSGARDRLRLCPFSRATVQQSETAMRKTFLTIATLSVGVAAMIAGPQRGLEQAASAQAGAAVTQIPKFRAEGSWPKLPSKWVMAIVS